MLKVALFPGCFDPFHKQHQKIIEKVLLQFKLDKIWILINKNSQEKKIIGSFKNRLQIIKNLLSNNSQIKIWDKPIGYYTTTLIKKLKKKIDNIDFYLILGSDQINKLDQWKHSKNIDKLLQIICIPRLQHPVTKQIKKKYSFHTLINVSANNFNSQSIKKGLNWSWLHSRTIKYLLETKVYFKNILQNNLNNINRIKHCYSVAKLAKKLAKRFNQQDDIQSLYLAALFHDLTKEWGKDKHKNFWKENDLNIQKLKSAPFPIWHAYTSAYYLRKQLQIKDKKIFQAIFYHTTANINFSTFSKILFIADKLEIQKKDKLFDLAKKALNNTKSTLDEIFAVTLSAVYQKIKSQKKIIHSDTEKAHQQYC